MRLSVYRPTRTSNADGTWEESLSSFYSVFGSMKLHNDKTFIFMDRHNAIRSQDIIEVQSQIDVAKYYRIIGSQIIDGTDVIELEVELVEKPVWSNW